MLPSRHSEKTFGKSCRALASSGNTYIRLPKTLHPLRSKTAIRRDFLLAAIGLYMAGFIAGIVLNQVAPEEARSFEDQLVDRLRAQFEGVEGAGRIYSKILLHNLSVCAIMSFAGIIFAVPPVFILLINGLPLGIVLARSENPLLVFAGSILPHGVFEFPATFLAGAFGILLGIDAFSLIRNWMQGEGEAPTRILLTDLRKVLKSFLLVVLLLVVAAAVETFLFIVYGQSA
jgi:stage II sporulation protein M